MRRSVVESEKRIYVLFAWSAHPQSFDGLYKFAGRRNSNSGNDRYEPLSGQPEDSFFDWLGADIQFLAETFDVHP
jgi:hypothetical protein